MNIVCYNEVPISIIREQENKLIYSSRSSYKSQNKNILQPLYSIHNISSCAMYLLIMNFVHIISRYKQNQSKFQKTKNLCNRETSYDLF